MSSGIGSVFEFSLRILLLLNEVNEKLDEEQIGAIDYAAVMQRILVSSMKIFMDMGIIGMVNIWLKSLLYLQHFEILC